MQPTTFLRTAILSLAFIPSLALAQGVTITVEQEGPLQSSATWTLSQPNQEQIARNDWKHTLTEQLSGKYTLFVTPLKGTNASITLSENGAVLQQLDHQISFEAVDGQNLLVQIKLKLVNTGNVAVNSEPSGVPFEVKGPNNWLKRGITPEAYEDVPVGNYSVQYLPKGCPKPAAKSDLLQKDGRSDFFLELHCLTFEAELKGEVQTHMQTEVEGESVTFTDVPLGAWFTPFVTTAAYRGILTGYRDELGNPTGRFGPANQVTLAELSKIAHELASVNEQEISDAPQNPMALWQWYTRYVASAEKRGWLVYQDFSADLHRSATRGEVMVTLIQALDIPMEWAKGTLFKDVTRQTKYAHAIETTANAGIVAGSTDSDGNATGYFNPENPITRAEMARILINTYEKFLRRAAPEF